MFQVYGIGQGLINLLPPPEPFKNAPTSNQDNYEIGQIAYTPPKHPTEFFLYTGGGNWAPLATSSGTLISLGDTADTIVLPNAQGSIQLVGTVNQIGVVANQSLNQLVFSATNPFDIATLNASGPVSLCTTTGNNINIGNSSQPDQAFVTNCFAFFNAGVRVQGSSGNPQGGINLLDGTLSLMSNFSVVSGTYNTTGYESTIQCAPTGAITINLSANYVPGSLVIIYDSSGGAAVNNITVNPPGGGFILQNNVAPASSYVMRTNYANLILYAVPSGGPVANFIILNQ